MKPSRPDVIGLFECLSPDTCVRCLPPPGGTPDTHFVCNPFACSCDTKVCHHQRLYARANRNCTLSSQQSGSSKFVNTAYTKRSHQGYSKFSNPSSPSDDNIEENCSDSSSSTDSNSSSDTSSSSSSNSCSSSESEIIKKLRHCLDKEKSQKLKCKSNASEEKQCSSDNDQPVDMFGSDGSNDRLAQKQCSSGSDEKTRVRCGDYSNEQMDAIDREIGNFVACSESEESSSEDSSDSDTTSESSDNSWWMEYQQLRSALALTSPAVGMKDSGYLSTTSPSVETDKAVDKS